MLRPNASSSSTSKKPGHPCEHGPSRFLPKHGLYSYWHLSSLRFGLSLSKLQAAWRLHLGCIKYAVLSTPQSHTSCSAREATLAGTVSGAENRQRHFQLQPRVQDLGTITLSLSGALEPRFLEYISGSSGGDIASALSNSQPRGRGATKLWFLQAAL